MSYEDQNNLNLIIRPATVNDCDGIMHVYRGEESWWKNPSDCALTVKHRLERGFYNLVALLDGQVAAHGEWIVDDGFEGKFLYLGMLQVDEDFQRRGMGRKILEAGETYARANNCGCIRLVTSTEEEGGAEAFYERCGFTLYRRIIRATIPTTGFTPLPEKYTGLEKLPLSVTREMPLSIGVTQTSARHMWEVINAPHALDRRIVRTVTDDKHYIQLGWFPGNNSAMALNWGKPDDDCVEDILRFAESLSIKNVTFYLFEQDSSLLDKFNANIQSESIEMEAFL